MPKPNLPVSNISYTDPNYPSLKFKTKFITDHFYDSGIYESQWKNAQSMKINHPFMGKMSFPEDERNPSRTIMATRSMTTREALIYKSEHRRRGDGEYRLPTIREIATLMGFPYSYQFSGAENTKWRQIGNAVCPPMSSALAKSVRQAMGLQIIEDTKISFEPVDDKLKKIQNLNTFTKKKFDNPPKRKADARFRRHPFKDGNMTIALTNYNPTFATEVANEWYTSDFMGSGKDFIVRVIPKSHFKDIGKLIEIHQKNFGKKFIREFEERFKEVIGGTSKFQEAYVLEDSRLLHEPSRLIDEISEFISDYELTDRYMKIPDLIPEKEQVPTRQVFAMYAINRLVS
jgi:DNA (cytosine-5)-methyltransferase 1